MQPREDSYRIRLMDDDGRVAVDLPCVDCGYNLRTLARDGMCPECGRPVVRSTDHRYLWQLPLSHVERLLKAARLLTSGLGLMLVCLAILGISGTVLFPTGMVGTPLWPMWAPLASCGALMVVLLLLLVILVALFELTIPDPYRSDRDERLSARRLIRWSLPLSPLTLLVPFAVPPPGPPWDSVTVVVLVGASAVILIQPSAVCAHLAALMRRVPRPGLVRFARVECWALAAAETALIVGIVVEWLAGRPARAYEGVLLWIWGLLAYAILVAGLVLLIRVTRALAHTHRHPPAAV